MRLFIGTLVLVLLGMTAFSCRDVDALDPNMRYQKALSGGKTTSKRTNELPLGLTFGLSRTEVDKVLAEQVTKGALKKAGLQFQQPYPLPAIPGKAEITYEPSYAEENGRQALVGLGFSITYRETAGEAEDDSVYAQKAFFREVTKQFRLDYSRGEFFSIPDEDFWRVITQINNNRRIDFFRKNRNLVLGQFSDLSTSPNQPLVVEDHR